MAQNDWIVAGLNNPTFTTSDFADIADMTVDNTQMLSMDEYLKSDFIKNNSAFSDANGNFSEEKFANYYQARLAEFGDFQNQDFQKGPALSMFDIMRTPESPIRDTKFSIQRGVNPDRQQIGIEGVNVWSDPRYSKREIAKQNKVFNTEEGKFEDYTPDERVLTVAPLKWLKDMFSEPLVMATWDEDGTHIDPLTGVEQQHHKGEYKLNDKGTYYYETLGGRSPMGKEVLTWNDTLTVDGQGINKYDFLDSNDIKKSARGIVGRTVASLIPLFCGPVVGGIYSTALIARELSKSMPMLYGMVTAFNDSQSPEWLNKMAAWGERGSWSQADYDKEHMFSFGNIANTLSDVALQWGQQQLIAKAFGAARGSTKIIEEARKKAMALYDAKKVLPGIGESPELMTVCLNKFMPAAEEAAQKAGQLGRDLSLVYMAVISNQDVYQDMLDHGTTKKEAAAVAFGSSLGMFAVDKWLHLGELFFDEATPDATKMARKAIKDEISSAKSQFDRVASSNAALHNKFFGLVGKAADASKRALNKFSDDLKYHTHGFFGKALGEGLEEVAEEVVSDMSKQLYEWAGDLGLNTTVKDVGAWDNAFDRYAMNFLGGAIGGSVFYGKTVWDRGSFRRPHLDQDIATLIRNGHVDELRRQLADLYQHNRTGSRTLSASVDDVTETDDGKFAWLTTKDPSKSQAKAIRDMVNDRINQIEEVLLTNRDINLSDDELFMNMVLSEKRYQRYRNLSGITGYYQDYGDTLVELTNGQMNYNRSLNTIDGLPTGKQITSDQILPKDMQEKKAKNLAAQQQSINEAKQKLKDFLSGDTSLRYTRMLNFAMDYEMFSPFVKLDQNAYAQELYHKDLKDLTEKEKEEFYGDKWPTYVNTELPTRIKEAYRRFEELEGEVTPELHAIEELVDPYRTFIEGLSTLTSTGALSQAAYEKGMILKNDTRIEGESKDDYNFRNKKKEGESDADYNRRRIARLRKIDQINNAQEEKWANNVIAELQKVGMRVDPATLRYIKSIVVNHGRLKDIIHRKAVATTNDAYIIGLFNALETDMKNVDELRKSITEDTKREVFNNTRNALQGLMDMTLTDPDGNSLTVEDLLTDTDLSLGETLIDLSDPDSDTWVMLSPESREALQKRLNILLNASNLPGQTMATMGAIEIQNTMTGMSNMDDLANLNPELAESINVLADGQSNSRVGVFDAIAKSINDNPVFRLQNDLKTTVVNPIGDLIKRISQKVGKDLVDIEQVLQGIQDNFDSLSDQGEFRLDTVQRDQLDLVSGYLDLLNLYIYAASTTPDMEAFVGHNKSINEFAEAHKDKLTKPWKRLPEIDVDIAALYIQNINEYKKEIETWKIISDSNQVNKLNKIAATEPAVLKAKAKVWKSITGSFSMNGKDYLPAEGLDGINLDAADGDEGQAILYQAEKRFYENIKKIAKKNGMTIADVVRNSNLLETVLPEIKKLTKQTTSDLDTFTLDNCELTDYDKLLYIISVLSEDPDIYYNRLQTRVAESPDMVPIVSQEHGSRILQAFFSQEYKDMMEYARSIMGDQEVPTLSNFVMAEGLAGTGKSSNMVVSAIQAIGDVPLVLAGPTMDQANALFSSIGRGTVSTIDGVMAMFYGEDNAKALTEACESDRTDTKFFFIRQSAIDGMAKVSMKEDSMTLLKPENMPKLIVIDEATHMPTAKALFLNKAAKAYGITVIVLGNFSQNGFSNTKTGMQNLDEGAVAMVRTPRLTLSMRNNNLQKFQNENSIYELTEVIRTTRLNWSEADYHAQFTSLRNILKGTSLVAYTDDDINGDLITPELTNDIITKLKAAKNNGKTVAVIGDSESPSVLKKLTDAGVKVDAVLTFDKMQGQEFDYVVVDHQFNQVADMPSLRQFVNDLYTAMTRATTGSVIMDRGLSGVLGPMQYSHHKVSAPSIKESIDQLRATKIAMLKSLNLPEIKTESVTEEKKEEKASEKKTPKTEKKEKTTEEKKEDKKEEEKRETKEKKDKEDVQNEEQQIKDEEEQKEQQDEEEEEKKKEIVDPSENLEDELNSSEFGESRMREFERRMNQLIKIDKDVYKARKFNELYPKITAQQDAGTDIPDTLQTLIDNFYDYMKSKGYEVADNGLITKNGKIVTYGDDIVDDDLVDSETTSTNESTDSVSGGSFMDKMFTDPDGFGNTDSETTAEDLAATSEEDVPNQSYYNSDAGTNYNLNGFFVTGYGDSLALGVEEDENESSYDYEYTDDDGTVKTGTTKAKKWTVRKPAAEGAVYRNLQAIVNPDEGSETVEALRYEDKVELERQFGFAHSYISFEHTWKDAPSCIKKNFAQKDWEAGHYEYEIRKADPGDRFPIHKSPELKTFGVIYTGEDGRKYGGGANLLFNIVFVVKDKTGHICKLDLSRVNDPRTLIKNLPKLRKDMEAQLAQLEKDAPDSALAGKLRNLLDKNSPSCIEPNAIAYKNWVDQQVKVLDTQDSVAYELPAEAIEFSKYTRLKRRPAYLGPLQLGERIDLNDPTNKTFTKTLRDLNPDKAISKTYVFTGTDLEKLKLDPSIVGKACVFVSDDSLLNPSSLIDLYIAQKENPNLHTPVVRLYLLDNVGLSISEISSNEFLQVFQESDRYDLPFNQSYTGVRMFTAMWNARASLMQLNNAVEDFCNTYKTHDGKKIRLSENQLEAILRVHRMAYDKLSDAAMQNVLDSDSAFGKGVETYQHAVAMVNEFNNKTVKDIPMFRLGWYVNEYQGKNKGLYVQSLSVEGSTFYDDGTVNFCFLTPRKAVQFQKMLDVVLDSICANDMSQLSKEVQLSHSLNVGLYHVTLDENGNEISRTQWSPTELIDLNDADHRLTLSGMITQNKDTGRMELRIPDDFKIKEGKNTIVPMLKGDFWAYIPKVVQKYIRTANYWARNYSDLSSMADEDLNIPLDYVLFDNEGNVQQQSTLMLDIASLFGSDRLIGGPTTVAGPNPGQFRTAFDYSMSDMFNMIFHGTIENVRTTSTKVDYVYFPYGCFINPDATLNSSGKVVPVKNGEGEAFLYQVGTSDAFFIGNADILGACVNVNVQALVDPEGFKKAITAIKSGKETTTSEAMDQAEIPTAKPELSTNDIAFINTVRNTTGESYSETVEDLERAKRDYVTKNNENLYMAAQADPTSVDPSISYCYEDGKFYTLYAWLKDKHNANLETMKYFSEYILFTTTDGRNRRFVYSTGEVIDDIDTGIFDENKLTRTYNGGTVLSALQTTLQSDSFKDTLQQYGLSPELADQALEEINTISTGDPGKVNSQIEELLNDPTFGPFFWAALDEDLLNKLYEC